MAGIAGASTVSFVLVVGDVELPMRLEGIDAVTEDRLAVIDHLLRLRLAATRCGWDLRVLRVDVALGELIDLLGVADRLELRARSGRRVGRQASRRSGSPNSGKRSG